mmetsp:Transcript_44282/g.74553  ORF Transcript_44282/g.74553 Transcript_44282/m.74553 type:complete len:99 (-) Transcript_44282:218-514(-)
MFRTLRLLASNRQTQVILLQDCRLGNRGKVLKVRASSMRNVLHPGKIAAYFSYDERWKYHEWVTEEREAEKQRYEADTERLEAAVKAGLIEPFVEKFS